MLVTLVSQMWCSGVGSVLVSALTGFGYLLASHMCSRGVGSVPLIFLTCVLIGEYNGCMVESLTTLIIGRYDYLVKLPDYLNQFK